MSFLWSTVSFLIVIAVLVAVHEYGHFWAARKCGVKVHRFSIGFGKVIWSRTDKRGTEFAVSAIPLGGYVKMLDGRNEEIPPEFAAQAFDNKTVAQRAFIIAAGPLANFLFAILAYFVIYSIGVPSIKPVIEEVQPHSIAAKAQVSPNTQITEVDGVVTPDWETINLLLATKTGESKVELTLVEFGSTIEQHKILDLSNWTFNPEKESAFGSLGIVPVRTKVDMTLSKVNNHSPAQKGGLLVGDKLYWSDGKEIVWQDFIEQVQQGKPLALKVERNGEWLEKTITPELNDKKRWFVGISPTFYPVADEYRTELKYDMLESLQRAVEKTFQLSWLTVKVIGKLIIGELSLNNLGGPISIAQGAGASSELGLIYYLSFMALISVNLGVMNLFPLPVLDGGYLVFLALEALKGKPVSEQVQNISYRIGAVLLLMLMGFGLINDFLRLN
ncbi:RIP metalloprotease RseP [Aggregatibacter actinomycetemcomitans]|uniref:Zinc metalloprotease n=2 Tax=Aggregatibacter actinomycetemcomitans TaxID=714 RepID=A0A5D0EIJ3_AGGAC|nr:sigma E protease regulator RseP [Aggregatibacter actinomycetemcomitans]AFI86723.1 zinc metallopeptidase RseP [Aggregatibacter actinomycetemcomitans D7S-1]AMQ93870.1 zinc metallopeptidase RseP [Aggregatibacter actinomycetemcomitans]ANU81983.1 RIP metalloprotease RseP [Aggregatibacter actinomycetemcomitans]EKX96188.1 RIP metalloprotease RseP [Aggregatibacter actinomycetemcomitans Y4]KND85242.1 zinc metallopeptidase RseP [Aggregatibacter actinomycetemcomitans serotype a str. H5P1]